MRADYPSDDRAQQIAAASGGYDRAMRISNVLRVMVVGAACVAAAGSAASNQNTGPALYPVVPPPARTETVATETPLDGMAVSAVPVGAAAWKISVQNDTDTPASVLWDESSFVVSSGDSAGRLIRGETRRMDVAKAQPPTPVPAHARVTELVLVEKLTEVEDLEARYAALGSASKELNDQTIRIRKDRRTLIVGGRIDLRVEMGGEKRTWTGRVSGGE